MPRQHRPRRLFLRTFCRRKHSRFRLWLNKRVGLACMPAFNTQATTAPDSRSDGGCRAGHCKSERRMARMQLDRQRANGSMQMDRTNPGNVTAANWTPLLLTSPNEFRPQLLRGVRFTRGAGRNGGGSLLSASNSGDACDIRNQLQGGLLAKPGRSADLAVTGTPDKWMFEDRLEHNPPRAARVYALIAATLLRRLYCQPGRQVHVLVHQAASARSGDRGLCSQCRTSRVTLRITRRSQPLGQRS